MSLEQILIRASELTIHLNREEAVQRLQVLQEALSWLGTPYHHAARVKGAGVDCGQFPSAVFTSQGVVKPFRIPVYPPDWCKHRDDERYLNIVLSMGHEIPGPPLPGDMAVWRWGRAYSHGAIVLEWPRIIIHAYVGLGVTLADAAADQNLAGRPVRFFSPWGE
jgi:cell wall-associated NlpC family hydrolase